MEMRVHTAYQRISGAKTMVVCVHGIQGSPHQFDWLVHTLPEDVDYACVLLPGHGGDVRDFRKCGAADWEKHVRMLCREYRKRYDRLVYAGHSMGCLLGICAAGSGIRFDGMLLAACPLALKPTLKYFIHNYRAAAGKQADNPYVETVRQANSVQASSPWQYLFCIRPYMGLFRLMRKARRCIPDLHMPLILLHSEGDEIVSKRSLRFFRGMPDIKADTLPGCGHFRYSPEARAQIAAELQSMIRL